MILKMLNETVISVALVSVFLTGYYQPINPAREWLTNKWIGFWAQYKMWRTAELAIVWNCAKCMAFIATFLLTWSLPQAILSSIIALIIKYIIKYVTRD